jgi:hypothetical protein
MDNQKLFDEVQKVGLVVDIVPKTVYTRYVWVLGEKFDAEDLYETLTEVRDSPSSTHMTGDRMVKAMINIGVIKSTSGTWGTNYDGCKTRLTAFISMLRQALKDSKSEHV